MKKGMLRAFLRLGNEPGGPMQFKKILITSLMAGATLVACQKHNPNAGSITTGVGTGGEPMNPPTQSTGMVKVDNPDAGQTAAASPSPSSNNPNTSAMENSSTGATQPAPASAADMPAPTTDTVSDNTGSRVPAASETLILHFQPGTGMVSTADRQRLQNFVAQKNAGLGNHIYVAVWADKLYKFEGTSTRPVRDDRTLAESRLNDIRKIIGNGTNLTGYNMADPTNWLERAISASDSDLDSMFAKRKPGTPNREDIDVFKAENAPSKAVIIWRAGAEAM